MSLCKHPIASTFPTIEIRCDECGERLEDPSPKPFKVIQFALIQGRDSLGPSLYVLRSDGVLFRSPNDGCNWERLPDAPGCHKEDPSP